MSTITTTAPPKFAVALVCADDGIQHLIRDDLATDALVNGGRATAVCGHKVLPSPLGMPAQDRCPVCPHAADVLALAAP